jgi:endoglucanase
VLPRWRGFNLTDAFGTKSSGEFHEDDFRWIAEWGFDFVRLPMCYRLWVEGGDIYEIKDSFLEKIDRAVDLGRKHGLHVCLNFHHAPGYCVNRKVTEEFNLWRDKEALDAFCFHWKLFAGRYRGIPSEQVSFNLVNEPRAPSEQQMTREDHERVIRAVVAAIREEDPDRLVIADGLSCANTPCPELADLKIAQSCRAYCPAGVSHYRASWVGGEDWPEPAWPGPEPGGEHWDRARLEKHYEPWIELARSGVGVHCGEGGAYKFTPHDVVLRWLRDVLEILTREQIGYALWNFRGPFGILDSGSEDVDYEDWHGHKLDRKLLDLLRRH